MMDLKKLVLKQMDLERLVLKEMELERMDQERMDPEIMDPERMDPERMDQEWDPVLERVCSINFDKSHLIFSSGFIAGSYSANEFCSNEETPEAPEEPNFFLSSLRFMVVTPTFIPNYI